MLLSLLERIKGWVKPTPKQPTIEFVSLTSISTTECMGWVKVYHNKLVIRVNGVTRIKRTKTNSQLTCHSFRRMFEMCIGTGETLHIARSKYKIVLSAKFKAGIGKNFI
ncbi:hypothetical protein N1M2_156 [Klebsiella phage N1M2]|uniref:Uncharacterized protein n=1 Tax=Klebsiella phage N1M2 TaxID=2664939 RepID=A0A6B7ZF97_9CAUD|nr:hypothetical protein PQB72_gp156 [Klebsiella phage N1M2]QGH72019.1 hypothetical protein N1M2_156 [Klebsiella phage N1M2]